jgi:hypothetical protein
LAIPLQTGRAIQILRPNFTRSANSGEKHAKEECLRHPEHASHVPPVNDESINPSAAQRKRKKPERGRYSAATRFFGLTNSM